MVFIALSITIVSCKTSQFYITGNKDDGFKIHESSKTPNSALAWATLQYSAQEIGWNILDLTTNTHQADELTSYAAGYLEGYITQVDMWSAFMSFANGTTTNYPSDVWQWIASNEIWYRGMASLETSQYWNQVQLVLNQYDGMLSGYNAAANESETLSPSDFMYYQLQFEIGDILSAVGQQVPARVNMDNHCSSLIKPSSDGQSLFAAHVTWSTFSSMLRTYKHYNFPYNLPSTMAERVSFSSFPGTIPSGDDFYITSTNLNVIETTNDILNMSLYKDYVTPNKVPYWIRILVANRMATNGSEWTSIFSEYNSGTYNNQWIIVDQKLFTPGETLQPGTLWIAEQVPGFIVAEDKTDYLINNGYWSSYNIPYYPFIYNISDYPVYYEKYGDMFSWSECARAQIFRRDQGKVGDMEGMKRIMRYNDYQNDPLSLHDACRGISARCDLNVPWATNNTMNGWSAFGGIDCKITDNIRSADMIAEAVSGPTWEFQPPFAWTNQWTSVPSFGQPKVFAFDFETMSPSN